MSGVFVIGAGHNGLAAAFYLAKAGLTPVVLEQRDTVGGGALTGEIHPGFSCPTLTHHAHLHADIVRDMALERHGVEWIASPTAMFAPSANGPALVLPADASRAADSLRHLSVRDAAAYPEHVATVDRIVDMLGAPLRNAPPDIDRPSRGDIWNLLTFGRRLRGLRRTDAYRLMRWGPMPVADLMMEWFETDLLRAGLSAPGLSGTMFGPRSAGSGLVLLLHHAHMRLASGRSQVRGGPGALTSAMAAAVRAAGGDIRTNARVDRVLVTKNRVSGVVVDGRELPARLAVSAVDPKTTFLKLVDAGDLGPEFRLTMQNFRAAGTVAKVNLALSALPKFDGAGAESLSGRIHIGPSTDYMERAFDRAKHGEVPDEPWLEVTMPSILDRALAPQGCHVMSIYVHYAAYRLRGTDWTAQKAPLLDTVMKTLERFAPGSRALTVAAQVLTPPDLEAAYGFSGGHIFHGELALDQLFVARPALGYGGYTSPICGLYLCGAGTHPGGFMSGSSGRLAARAALRNRQAP